MRALLSWLAQAPDLPEDVARDAKLLQELARPGALWSVRIVRDGYNDEFEAIARKPGTARGGHSPSDPFEALRLAFERLKGTES